MQVATDVLSRFEAAVGLSLRPSIALALAALHKTVPRPLPRLSAALASGTSTLGATAVLPTVLLTAAMAAIPF